VGEETENVQEELKSVSKQEKGNGRPFEWTEQILSYHYESCKASVLPQYGINELINNYWVNKIATSQTNYLKCVIYIVISRNQFWFSDVLNDTKCQVRVMNSFKIDEATIYYEIGYFL
jgi:hypothetical protein